MKMLFPRWLRAGVLAMLVACDSDHWVPVTANNFDSPAAPPGWSSPPGPLAPEHPRSGGFSTWVGLGRAFSDGYSAPLGEVEGGTPRKLRVRAWVWVTNVAAHGDGIVMTIGCKGRRADVWQVRSIDQVVKRYQQWEAIDFTYELPADLLPTDQLTVYMWASRPVDTPGKDPIFLDDIQLDAWR